MRIGFVSNSSSSSFLVTNRTNKCIGERKFLNLLSFLPERYVNYILEEKENKERHDTIKSLFFHSIPRTKILPKRLKGLESIVVDFGSDYSLQTAIIEECVINLYPKRTLVTEDLRIKFLESNH